MGNSANQHQGKLQLNVATINYSGILLSPFEFYEQQYDKQQQKLNQLMKSLLEQFKVQCEFDILDRIWNRQRYSPMYHPDCGIKKDKRFLMNQKQFKEQWRRWYKQNEHNLLAQYRSEKQKKKQKHERHEHKQGEDNNQPKSKKQISSSKHQRNYAQQIKRYCDNIQQFDFVMYYAILKYSYTGETQQIKLDHYFLNNKNAEDKKLQLEANTYRQYMKKKFDKSFLNQDEKIRKTLKIIQDFDIDIFFLQEATQKFVEQAEKLCNNIRIVKSCKQSKSKVLVSKSIILIRENPVKFPKLRSLRQENSRLTNNINILKDRHDKPVYLTASQIQGLNFNKDTVIQFLYNIILICPHLTSKKQKNEQQMQDFKKKLAFLKERFPQCHIIAAGDLNNDNVKQYFSCKYEQHQLAKYFYAVPDSKLHITCKKQRTNLQAQQNKATQKPQITVKDYIISDLQIHDEKVSTIDKTILIDSEKIKDVLPLLPTNNHPFDHFLLTGKIYIDHPLEHVSDHYYLYKYQPHMMSSADIKKLQQELQQQKQRRRLMQ